MKLRELMAQVDLNRVVDAFLLLDYNFSAENFENSFIEKYEAIPKLRKIVEENIRQFAECEPNDDIVSHTIFIMYIPDNDYENQWKKKFSGFAICDEEALSVMDKDFHIFDDEGEAILQHYSFENIPIQKLSNYIIAQSSLDKFGKEICAAKILSELFCWGALPKEREKNVNEVHEIISKPIDEKRVESKSVEEIMGKYKERLMLKMSDDVKKYYLAKERFAKETEDIVERYEHRVIDEIHKQYIDIIKAEYKGR